MYRRVKSGLKALVKVIYIFIYFHTSILVKFYNNIFWLILYPSFLRFFILGFSVSLGDLPLSEAFLDLWFSFIFIYIRRRGKDQTISKSLSITYYDTLTPRFSRYVLQSKLATIFSFITHLPSMFTTTADVQQHIPD